MIINQEQECEGTGCLDQLNARDGKRGRQRPQGRPSNERDGTYTGPNEGPLRGITSGSGELQPGRQPNRQEKPEADVLIATRPGGDDVNNFTATNTEAPMDYNKLAAYAKQQYNLAKDGKPFDNFLPNLSEEDLAGLRGAL